MGFGTTLLANECCFSLRPCHMVSSDARICKILPYYSIIALVKQRVKKRGAARKSAPHRHLRLVASGNTLLFRKGELAVFYVYYDNILFRKRTFENFFCQRVFHIPLNRSPLRPGTVIGIVSAFYKQFVG